MTEDTKQEVKDQAADAPDAIERAIEVDIKHLKRSSNFLAAMGLLIIILFGVLLSIQCIQRVGTRPIGDGISQVEQCTVIVNEAIVYRQPRPTAAQLTTLRRGEALYITGKDKTIDYYQVRVYIKMDGANEGQDGWILKTDVQTISEERKKRAELAQTTDQIIAIEDEHWTIDEVGRFFVSGKLVNMTNVPLNNIKLSLTFYDGQNNLVDRRFKTEYSDEPLKPGEPQLFHFTGMQKKDFHRLVCRAEYAHKLQ